MYTISQSDSQLHFRFVITDCDKIFEFSEYQLLNDTPETIWASAREKMYTRDGSTPGTIIWAFLSSMKTPNHCSLMFPRLSRRQIVLQHLNASEERVFSLVRFNKTLYQLSLGLERTFSIILTIKMLNYEPCFNFDPSKSIHTKAKK